MSSLDSKGSGDSPAPAINSDMAVCTAIGLRSDPVSLKIRAGAIGGRANDDCAAP